MNKHRNILIVEEDDNLRLSLQDNLTIEEYKVDAVSRVVTARESLAAGNYELIILDIMLPDGDAYKLCEEIRKKNPFIMVLMLTTRALEEDLIRGFNAGADDYVTKPYKLAEILLRVKALLRRAQNFGNNDTLIQFNGLSLDIEAQRLMAANGQEIKLTHKEFKLLVLLLQFTNLALTRDEILNEVWGENIIVDSRTVDNFVFNLKKKLNITARSVYRIDTIRGVGYRLTKS